MIEIICIVLFVYWLVLLARILMSWFPPPRSPAARRTVELLHDVTEPVLRPIRGLLPPMRMGAMALDLSPIILFIALAVLRSALRCGI